MKTRLTEKFNLTAPLISAPMAVAAGGALAAGVSRGGGLGMLGGGYGDGPWLEQAFQACGNQSVGCGFITWRLREQPHLLELALRHKPKAMMLSFGDPTPYAPEIHAADVPLICQVQNLDLAKQAIDAGASVLIAQGGEAGGHGLYRATMTLVPELADYCAGHAADVSVVAAGGIADGRGLAAALMLGAEGVLMGSRFWATQEAQVPESFHKAALNAKGDDTTKGSVPDIARGYDWPLGLTTRTLKTGFFDDFQGSAAERAAYVKALETGDPTIAGAIVGEGVAMIHDIPKAEDLVKRLLTEARAAIANYS